MSPKLFECFLFLKYNRKYWDRSLIIEAYRLAKAKARNARLDQPTPESILLDAIAKEFENSVEI